MRTKEQAQVSIFPAIAGLIFFLIGRPSYRLWGLTILAVSLVVVTYTGSFNSSPLRGGVEYLKSFSLPTLIQTVSSPIAKHVSEEEILESQGLVKTPDGLLHFTQKRRVFATSYDKNCSGCNETTAVGLKTGFGVVAVDPKIIPLGTKLFIPGYGLAVAGDTGGAIKGDKIDLGFDDVKHGWWSSRFVEIYILR